MSTFYLVFEICALLTVIVLPLAGPKNTKAKKTAAEKSNLYVNEDGLLEYLRTNKDDHHHVL
ncbi:hypothetical protein [Mucilaginibacter sp. L196]|uniref:hypothetical protein n=1 Tax=Mucilaginibacter sp. L196 TaxID=1641870 RepID=UPI00131E8685|nr:hypothetical protein [Mucilaginibacter sp. L196]